MAVELNDQQRLERAVRSLRNFIRDKKELNQLLLGKFESNDEELRQAIVSALIDWNMTPPLITPVSLATHPNKPLLIRKAALEAMESSGIWHSREHMPSSDGGTSADDHAKASEYSGWIERIYQDYERKKSDLKMAQNIAEGMNDMGLASEYSGALAVYGELW